jgi:hypothetical protein
VKNGSFTPKVEAFGLASGVVRYVANPALVRMVPAGLAARVKAASDSLAAGTLVAAPRPASMQAMETQGEMSTSEAFSMTAARLW